MAQPFPRIAGRVGQPILLDATFYNGGIAEEPYAVRRIEIYKSSVRQENLVAIVPISDPGSTNFPLPLTRTPDRPGYLTLSWDVPKELSVPDIFFDKWVFLPQEPGSGHTIDDPELLREKCMRFWCYPENSWYVDDGLESIRFGFEPLDVKYSKGERRPLEVGLMPLPLYDYNSNLVMPLIPMLRATITVRTRNYEVVVDEEPMSIALRQGSYRSNPFVARHLIDTNCFLAGTYVYRVTLWLPNGQSIRSKEFEFTIGI